MLGPGDEIRDKPRLNEKRRKTRPLPTDEKFFSELDLRRPALADVRKHVQKKDYRAAKGALADYFRTRTIKTCEFDPHSTDRNIHFSKKRANAAARGHITINRFPHTFEGGTIDWLHNPTKNRDYVRPTPQWTAKLNRMHFWKPIAKAYWATGDEHYAKAWVRQLRG
jgi:heparan-sulfate lyase